MSTWIDFDALRNELKFEDVLRHYGVEIKLKARGQHVGFCPLPTHNGKRNSPSFSASLERGIWQCFGCGERGNVLHFACRMESLDPENGRDFRKAALKMRELFLSETKVSKADNPKAGRDENRRPPSDAQQKKPVIINPPLDFELKDLDHAHPYLAKRKLTTQTVKKFGLGFCCRGYFKNRVVIPLYDVSGRLIGYAGRLINDDEISEENPKYLFPGSRERDVKILEFRKSLFLYGGHLIKKRAEITELSAKMQRLTDAYLDQLLDRLTFVAKKAEILERKKTVQEQIALVEKNQSGWLELLKKWIKNAENIGEIAKSGSPQEKKQYASQLFGSNLFLDCKKARGDALKPWSLLVENPEKIEMVPRLGLEPRTN